MAASTVMEALTAELLGDVGKLHERVKDLDAALPEAAETIRAAGRDVAQEIKGAVQAAVTDLSKGAAEVEVARIQAQVGEIAQAVLSQVRKEASAAAPHGWKIKAALGMGGLILLGGLAGGIIGAAWFGKGQVPSAEEAKQIEAGRDFLQVLPQLDDATKEKLVWMIQKNREK